MNFENVRTEMKSRGIVSSKFEKAYDNLLHRIELSICAQPGGKWGETRRIQEYSLVLRQTLLHRAIKLLEGAIFALIHDNGYSMALSVRGHFETTAAIGYLHNRLTSLKEGNLDPETVDKDIRVQILGTRDESILKKWGQEVKAKQVLNMLEYADKSVSKYIMNGAKKEHSMLMDVYKYLCEYSHPNFHSNALAFTLDTRREKFSFAYNSKITNKNAEVIEHILMSCQIFEELYDRIEKLLPATQSFD